MKELKISYMKKSGKLPDGMYAFKKPNIWYPVLYFRKPKNAKQKEYEAVIYHLTNKNNQYN